MRFFGRRRRIAQVSPNSIKEEPPQRADPSADDRQGRFFSRRRRAQVSPNSIKEEPPQRAGPSAEGRFFRRRRRVQVSPNSIKEEPPQRAEPSADDRQGMRFFERRRRGRISPNSIKEERLQRADPSADDRQDRFFRRRRRAQVSPNSIREEPPQRADPSAEGRQPAAEPGTAAPQRGPVAAVPSEGAIGIDPLAAAQGPAPPAPSIGASESCPSAAAIFGSDQTPVSSSDTDESMSSASSSETSSPSPSSSDNLSLESFNFHRVLGQGGFGKVVLATHRVSDQKVAVKIVKKRPLLPGYVSSAHTERLVLQNNRHSPFMTYLLGSFQTELVQDYVHTGSLWGNSSNSTEKTTTPHLSASECLMYVMEYLSGGDLDDLIKVEAPISGPTLRILTSEILCGLLHLHSRGILHRDLKPGNVLLDSRGHCRISDFGLSVTDMFHPRKITGLAGTLMYMAPEVLCDLPYGLASDYFSLGVMVYKMATRKNPYYGMDIGMLLHVFLHKKPKYTRDLDHKAKDLIRRLLEIGSFSRYKNVQGLREHPFFHGTNWAILESCAEHPIIRSRPLPEAPLDQIIDLAEVVSSAPHDPIPAQHQQLFSGFSFLGDQLKP
ncbi:PREDICTED: protein kinase C delta type-like [Nanorana parkeri]|uniref:protein kinase C delta type-like n=1 Tax=Nanorana parkeri TaxID=125878 RepID=UPI00085448CF|nr:PREDICTED: protein kinase C delta type-like [Nanorana parkeri]